MADEIQCPSRSPSPRRMLLPLHPMPQEDALHQILQRLTILNVASIIGIIAAARLLTFAIRKVFTLSAEKSTPLWRTAS